MINYNKEIELLRNQLNLGSDIEDEAIIGAINVFGDKYSKVAEEDRNFIISSLLDVDGHDFEEFIESLKCGDEEYYRECSHCNKIFVQGFCIEAYDEYYCSEECLFKNMTPKEYKNLYDKNLAYFTEYHY